MSSGKHHGRAGDATWVAIGLLRGAFDLSETQAVDLLTGMSRLRGLSVHVEAEALVVEFERVL